MTRNRKQKRKVRREMDSAGTCYLQAARNLSEAGDLQPIPLGIPTLLPKLTELISGWQPGSLNTVSSVTGGGRTTFALASALEALRAEVSVLLVSTELAEPDLDIRLVASLSGESIPSVMDNLDGSIHNWSIEMADRQLQSWDGEIFARLSADSLSMVEEAARVRANTPTGLGMLIVDGFEQLRGDGLSSFSEQMEQSSRRLKALALELDIPVLVTAQISRLNGAASPELSGVRSRALVTDSDTVLILNSWPNGSAAAYSSELPGAVRLAKNRFGTASVLYTVDYQTQRFSPRIGGLDPDLQGNPILRDWADEILSGSLSPDDLLQGWTTDGMAEEGLSLATMLEVRIAMFSMESLLNDLRATGTPLSLEAGSPIREVLDRWKSDAPLDESGPRATPEASVLAYHRRQLDLEEVAMELAALDHQVYYSKSGPYTPSKTGYSFEHQMDRIVALGAVTVKFRNSVSAMRSKLSDCTVWELGEHGGNWFVEGTEDRVLAEAAFRGWLLQTDAEQAKERETTPEGPAAELNFTAKPYWFWSPLFPEIEGSESELCSLDEQRDRWNGQRLFSGTRITD